MRILDHPRSRGVYQLAPTHDIEQTGSSPLARGLPFCRLGCVQEDGIIPARAGFTGSWRTGRPHDRDHPRSRGVYSASLVRVSARLGSSPLARGLPRPGGHRRQARGIIPARAGFTPDRAPPASPRGDHPRSRGVYPLRWAAGCGCWGSSPLARGLRTPSPSDWAPTRIIPARAGFTHGLHRRGHRRGDHPRSRGVYWTASRGDSVTRGSSPLARGLHRNRSQRNLHVRIIPARAGFTEREREEERGRIIPARAGFTCPGVRPAAPPRRGIIPARAGFTPALLPGCVRRRDHPRSRGVYTAWSKVRASSRGSSPLARGLRAVRRSCRSWSPDHPRSRGVYASPNTSPSTPTGSSPLARGLRGADPCLSPGCGIIPARAGFTRTPAPISTWTPDHPRSRGVYPTEMWARTPPLGSSPLARGLRRSFTSAQNSARIIPARAGFTADAALSRSRSRGSSPLARGLLDLGVQGGQAARIIPARAGFTRPRLDAPSRRRDHPRSRGVYPPSPPSSATRPGSSPLARGLHGRHLDRPDAPGIIPARAGFTARRRRSCAGPRDHPRSRGVYACGDWRPNSAHGSSPLARGLPSSTPRARCWGGIIPARAGFTRATSAATTSSTDHPRSRGVYHGAELGRLPGVGSSPLARGLPPGPPPRPPPRRIIPARAGFTIAQTAAVRSPWDHPRSRGVYGGELASGRASTGSSPLARGLQLAGETGVGWERIIPARAGFTDGRSPTRSSPQDHPRSRGVYPDPPRRGGDVRGSSPLARGLQFRSLRKGKS